MSTRYVWEKYSLAYEESSNHVNELELSQSRAYEYVLVFYSKSYTFSNGKYTLVNPSLYAIEQNDEFRLDKNYYFALVMSDSATGTFPSGGVYDLYQDAGDGSKIGYQCGSKIEVWVSWSNPGVNVMGCSVVKGVSTENKVSHISGSAYPEDSRSGSYWYVKQGSDCIDPTAVSIPSEIEAGGSLPVTVTKRSNTYGGTITYTYQYSIDGGSTWTSAGSTTATTKSITVPDGAETIKVRVVAKDNLGFTSTTYVTSNEAVVLSGTNFTAGVEGVVRELSELDTCVDGVIRPLTHAAVSVDGVLREIF